MCSLTFFPPVITTVCSSLAAVDCPVAKGDEVGDQDTVFRRAQSGRSRLRDVVVMEVRQHGERRAFLLCALRSVSRVLGRLPENYLSLHTLRPSFHVCYHRLQSTLKSTGTCRLPSLCGRIYLCTADLTVTFEHQCGLPAEMRHMNHWASCPSTPAGD